MRVPAELFVLCIAALATGGWAAPHPESGRARPGPGPRPTIERAHAALDAGAERGERSPYLIYNAAAFGAGPIGVNDVLSYVLAPVAAMNNVRIGREPLPGQSYAVWLTGPSRSLGVQNGSRWVTCRLIADFHRGSQASPAGSMPVIVVRLTAMTCRDSPGVGGTKCPKDYSIFDPEEVSKSHVSNLLASLAKMMTTGRAGRATERPPTSFEI